MTSNTLSLTGFIKDVASRSSTPGGGAVAAVTGAQAAALISMVQKFSELPSDAANNAANQFLILADEDSKAFDGVMKAYRRPKSERQEALSKACKEAASPPAEMVRLALSLVDAVSYLEEHGNTNLVTDTAMAALLLQTTLESAVLNILINLQSIDDQGFVDDMQVLIAQADSQQEELKKIASDIRSLL